MQKRTGNRWLDIQIVIATLAMTFTLALWNIFAGASRADAVQTVTQTETKPTTNTAVQQSALPATRLYLGGSAPQAAPSISSAPAASSPVSAPAPAVVTGSSRP
jgi:hypothetical protein